MTRSTDHQVCDYEGSAYRTEFWGQGRAYEDEAERVALRHMLPPTGHRLVDIGGGYGRLIPLYSGYDHVVIFDYALSQLRQAQRLWGSAAPGGSPRYTYVAGDFYHLPFAPTSFDTVVMVRTLHHATDAPSVLQGVSEILAARGSFVLEFANKRNLKAILRYLAGRQDWSPFAQEPVEFVPLNFDFHPAWIEHHLSRQRLHVRERRAVSSFRLALLKRLLPTRLLTALDRACQPTAEILSLAPSVFLRCQPEPNQSQDSAGQIFCCPTCGSATLEETPQSLTCAACDATFPIQNGIYSFKAPQPGEPAQSTPRQDANRESLGEET
jgi:SAM-dependent methyltransferase